MAKKFFSALLIFTSASIVANSQLTGRVVGVTDGDTLTVLDAGNRQHKIRLAGIDAPEARQDFGQKAKRHLSDLIFGKSVLVEGTKIDRYGRRVGKILIEGKNANLEMVKAGLAWHFKQYEQEQSVEDRRLYAAAEISARSAKLNIWSMPNPVPPWEFRHPPPATAAANGPIIGNRNSRIYHLPNCPDYQKVSERNRVPFKTRAEAEAAGYRAARNCS